MDADTQSLLAGGGVAGSIVTLILVAYRLLCSSKSKCHGEMNGMVLDIHKADSPVPRVVVVSSDAVAHRTRSKSESRPH